MVFIKNGKASVFLTEAFFFYESAGINTAPIQD